MDTQELYVTADLSHIQLTEKEISQLALQVDQMVAYFSKMSEFDVSGLEPTTHMQVSRSRVRADERRDISGADPDTLLEAAEELEDRFIVIPNVL
ncbi:MAG: Asp-tRNA(Asn)/Glu-tRNA(Gln) amidotransferase subunit GatC [Spirochaeta sp.]|nr:Asp-tRNA(Asn)/Glu-tRNA(Gln) amidotransferase subunit GatC [Spirochaeta sp.]